MLWMSITGRSVVRALKRKLLTHPDHEFRPGNARGVVRAGLLIRVAAAFRGMLASRMSASRRHEDAVGHAYVEIHVVVERRAEAVQEGDATEPVTAATMCRGGGDSPRLGDCPLPAMRGIGHGSGQVHQRPDAREQLVRVGERVGVERHDGGLLVHDPDHPALLGGRLAERIDPLAVVVADHDHPRMTGDRVDAEIDRPAAKLGKVQQPAGLVGQGPEAVGELGREIVYLPLGCGPREPPVDVDLGPG